MLTHREAYIYGWVYGKIDTALVAKTNYGVKGVVDPPARPLTSSAVAIAAAARENVLKPLDRAITAAYSEITYVEDANPEPVQPMEIQGSWWLGYYKAKAGEPLPPPEEPTKIAERRRRKGLSQTQLADIVGVSQTQISRWELGKDNIPADKLAKLNEALD